MLKRIISVLLCLSVFLMIFTACGNNTKTIKNENEFRIVTSFFPIMLITKALTNNISNVSVVNLTKPQTGCLHDYALMPEDIKTLETADVFVINGLGMENFIEKVTESLPNLKIVDLSKGVTPIEENAHIWLSPKNVVTMAKNLKDALCEANPENCKKYGENFGEYEASLVKLDRELKEELKPIAGKSVITFHEAFAYFTNEYNLKTSAVIEREPGEEPTTGDIKNTISIINKTKTNVLLTEPQYSSSAAEVISKETGAKIYEIDPIVTGTEDEAYTVYFDKMRNNAKILAEALK